MSPQSEWQRMCRVQLPPPALGEKKCCVNAMTRAQVGMRNDGDLVKSALGSMKSACAGMSDEYDMVEVLHRRKLQRFCRSLGRVQCPCFCVLPVFWSFKPNYNSYQHNKNAVILIPSWPELCLLQRRWLRPREAWSAVATSQC